MLAAQVHVASIQHRGGAPDVIEGAKQSHPSVVKFFADGGQAGERLASAVSHIEELVIEIAKHSDTAKGFVLLPKRWVVERSFGWLGRRRRAKGWEATIASAEAWLLRASICRMTRAIARA